MILFQEIFYEKSDDWYQKKKDCNVPKYSIHRDNIYAGYVMKYNSKTQKSKPQRKILFSLNQDGTVNDLLYDSPNYSTTNDKVNLFYVSKEVHLKNALESKNYSSIIMTDEEIKNIFQDFLSKNGHISKLDYQRLGMAVITYKTLLRLSKKRKKPTKDEKKDVEKFKTKIKTYTFR